MNRDREIIEVNSSFQNLMKRETSERAGAGGNMYLSSCFFFCMFSIYFLYLYPDRPSEFTAASLEAASSFGLDIFSRIRFLFDGPPLFFSRKESLNLPKEIQSRRSRTERRGLLLRTLLQNRGCESVRLGMSVRIGLIDFEVDN